MHLRAVSALGPAVAIAKFTVSTATEAPSTQFSFRRCMVWYRYSEQILETLLLGKCAN